MVRNLNFPPTDVARSPTTSVSTSKLAAYAIEIIINTEIKKPNRFIN